MPRESYLAVSSFLEKGLQNEGKLNPSLMVFLFLKHTTLHESLWQEFSSWKQKLMMCNPEEGADTR